MMVKAAMILILDPDMKKSASLLSEGVLRSNFNSAQRLMKFLDKGEYVYASDRIWKGHGDVLREYILHMEDELLFRQKGVVSDRKSRTFPSPFDNHHLIMSNIVMYLRRNPEESHLFSGKDLSAYMQLGIFNMHFAKASLDDPVLKDQATSLLCGDPISFPLPNKRFFTPVPKYLLNPVYCKEVIKQGDREGETCDRLVLRGDMCSYHRNINMVKDTQGCQHINSKGNPCKRVTEDDQFFCKRHSKRKDEEYPDVQCSYTLDSGQRCVNGSSHTRDNKPYCNTHLPPIKCDVCDDPFVSKQPGVTKCPRHRMETVEDPDEFTKEGYDVVKAFKKVDGDIIVIYRKNQ